MDVQQVGQQWTSILLGVLGLVVTASIPIIGFVVRIIFARISEIKEDMKGMVTEAKSDAKALVIDEERRRDAAIGTMLAQVNIQYTAITSEIHNLRNDIRDLRDDK